MNNNKEIEKINIDKLAFDLENPRLPTSLHNNKDDADVVTWMVKNAKLIELMTSIASQGFFDGEPLLAYQDPQSDKYVVVEGNRRLAAVKLLNNATLSQTQKNKIKEVVDETYDDDIQKLPIIIYESRDEIVEYLGYRHITGVKSWGALAKAKYLSQLRDILIKKQGLADNDYQSQYIRLAKDIGSSSNYVARLLTGLKIYEHIEAHEFFDIPELTEESINFSLLTTALSYQNISKYIGLDSAKDIEIKNLQTDKLKDLSEWIYKKNDAGNTRLVDSRNLKNLSAVVKHKIALAKFRSGEANLEEAVFLTDQPIEVFNNALSEVLKHFKIASDMVNHIDQTDDKQIERLKEIAEFNRNLHTIVKSKLVNQDDDPFTLS